MNIALWVVQGLLAAIFLLTGGMKALRSKAQLLANKHMGWANDFSATQIKLIGWAEVLGALGLTLPWALSIAPILTPAAAGCLAIVMGGAALIHKRRNEPFAPPLVLGILALGVAIGRLQTL
jgi:DoxX-like protein